MNLPFCRLFEPTFKLDPATAPVAQFADLEALGREMIDAQGPDTGNMDLTAGYTYFGQFIDHDLSRDDTPLAAAGSVPVEKTVNARLPALDLDSLYGGGPEGSPQLYDHSRGGTERFLLGQTLEGDAGLDVPRDAQGAAILADFRNDQNLLISQFTLLFLKLHNLVLDRLALAPPSTPGETGWTQFQKARRIVTWHYQWLVWNDFLAKLLDPQATDEAWRKGPFLFRKEHGFRGRRFEVPMEFALAAFRFGHSMVRQEYTLNTGKVFKPLDEILGVIGGITAQPVGTAAHPSRLLPGEWVVDWGRFFRNAGGVGNQLIPARKIDTRISAGLFNVPFPQGDPPELSVRTLKRGALVGLPSGQDAARDARVRARVIEPAAFHNAGSTDGHLLEQGRILQRQGWDRQTPLWYYLLKEAELNGDGKRLGDLGSVLVSHVVLAALLTDPDSYLNRNPGWQPYLGRRGNEPYEVGDLVNCVLRAKVEG